MRAKRPMGVLALLLMIGLMQASVVLATHSPQVSDVVAVASDPSTYNMACRAGTSQVDCTASDPDFTWHDLATITPGSGDLLSLNTTAAVAPFWAAPLDSYFRTWMTDLQAVPCNGITRALTAFVASVGNLTTDGTITPLTITSECNLTGGLTVKRDVTGAPTEYDYWINSSVIAAPTPTPTPTPVPTPPPPSATPRPTASPTITASPTASPRATATATRTATATPATSGTASESLSGSVSGSAPESASVSASESASTGETEDSSPTPTPEQSVAGTTFSPEPSIPAGKPDQGVGGWPGTVPAVGRISTNAADIGGSALAAVLLLVVMGFVGELFNNTMEANYDRILGWWKESWVGRIGRGLGGLFGGGSA